MTLTKNIFLATLTILCFYYSKANDSSFHIANTLKSHMVVQRSAPLVIWGTARPGSSIVVKADWYKLLSATTAKDGQWSIKVPVPNSKSGDFEKHKIIVECGKQKKELSDILFGDVWLCGGQSNMDMTIKPFLPWLLGALNYRYEVDNANYPQIRLFDVRTDFKADPQNDCLGEWKICSPTTAGDFSALAYFFAREIFNRTKVPIGLITSTVGGSSCQAWISRQALSADEVLSRKYLYPYDTSRLATEPLDSTVTFEKVVRPTLFYNAMIHPLRKISIAGALWYQGESNKDDGALYTRLCAAMIQDWRRLFQNDSLPFYYVQVAPYNWQQNDSTAYNYALLREAQSEIENVVPQSGMALTMDIADPADIHPRNKQEIGYRLAKLALAKTYNMSAIVSKGPVYVSHHTVNDTVVVKFKPESIGSGLATNDGLAPKHFYIATENGPFEYAYARIANNSVYLFSEKVRSPVKVRYAFTNYPVTNFENTEGFPAVPFRTDRREPVKTNN